VGETIPGEDAPNMDEVPKEEDPYDSISDHVLGIISHLE